MTGEVNKTDYLFILAPVSGLATEAASLILICIKVDALEAGKIVQQQICAGLTRAQF